MSEGLVLAQQINHPRSREVALEYAALVHVHRGEPELALSLLVAAEAVRAEQRVSWVFEPRLLLGGAAIAQDAATDAIIHLRGALAPLTTPAGSLGRPSGFCLLAQALAQQGRHGEALAALNLLGFARIEATGGVFGRQS